MNLDEAQALLDASDDHTAWVDVNSGVHAGKTVRMWSLDPSPIEPGPYGLVDGGPDSTWGGGWPLATLEPAAWATS